MESNANGSNQSNYNYDSYSLKSSSQTSLKGGFSTLIGGFGGYSGKEASDRISLDHSQQIDPQIEFCLKRLLKKDSITKLKALEDLRKLFTSEPIDKLKAAASAWAYAFNKLALVNDKRIRENVHLCFTPFCRQISNSKAKWFTPHLPRIFLYWWMHQHDTAKEVTQSALTSFYAAFGHNESRHWKVICYVKSAMIDEMTYILDPATTPQTLSNHVKRSNETMNKKGKPKIESAAKSKKSKKGSSSPEDSERYERTIASCLCGLATLISKEIEMAEASGSASETPSESTQSPQNEESSQNTSDSQKKKKSKTKSTSGSKSKSKSKSESEWWFEPYRNLLCSLNVWRFINDRSPILRKSAYLLCASCLSDEGVANEVIPLIAGTLFRCMSESYAPNMDNLWTALLALVQYQSAWKFAKKKSFVVRLCSLVNVDIFTACKYLRAFLLFVPSSYLFTAPADASNAGNDSEDGMSSKSKKKKKKKRKSCKSLKLEEDGSSYPIVKVLKAVWKGALDLSHLHKRFKAITLIYFKLLLQILVMDNNAKSDDATYLHDVVGTADSNDKRNRIETACKSTVIEQNVTLLIRDSLKNVDCPSLFFDLLGQYFMPRIISYDYQVVAQYHALKMGVNLNEHSNENEMENEMKSDDHSLLQQIQAMRDNVYYDQIVVESVRALFQSLQNEFVEPFSDLMMLVTEDMAQEEGSEIADKTEEFVADYKSAIHKISALTVHLLPFVDLENILFTPYKLNGNNRDIQKTKNRENSISQNDADDIPNTEDDEGEEDGEYWNTDKSVKFILFELMNEIWDFQSIIELRELRKHPKEGTAETEVSDTSKTRTGSRAHDDTASDHGIDNEVHNMIDIDTESEDFANEHDPEEDFRIDFHKLFVSNPSDTAYAVMRSSLLLIQDIIPMLAYDLGCDSASRFAINSFLSQELMDEGLTYLLGTLQSAIPMEYSSGILELLLNVAHIILNRGLNPHESNEHDKYSGNHRGNVKNRNTMNVSDYQFDSDLIGNDMMMELWRSFLESISLHQWSLKNVSLFINIIVLQNVRTITMHTADMELLKLLETFLTKWISIFLNVKSADNPIITVSSVLERESIENALENVKAVPPESYTALILSLQSLFGKSGSKELVLSPGGLESILNVIVLYIDAAIESARGESEDKVHGVTKDKTHTIIRSLSTFLETDWMKIGDDPKGDSKGESEEKVSSKTKGNSISMKERQSLRRCQLLLVSKLFTLCFARNDSDDPDNATMVCEYLFKKVVRSRVDMYSGLLKEIARALRLPWYFTANPLDSTKNVPQFYNVDHDTNHYQIPIEINRNPSRWRWCVQTLLLLESTSFLHGLQLIDIILDRQPMERIFALALYDVTLLTEDKAIEILDELSGCGVSLWTLQRCRDVVCDLSDLIGMELVLYAPLKPYSNRSSTNVGDLTVEQRSHCDRQWLVCWMLSFEEKLSWLPLSTLPDPSVIEHQNQWKAEMWKKWKGDNEDENLEDTAGGNDEQSARFLFAKPRVFSNVFLKRALIRSSGGKVDGDTDSERMLFEVPQQFLDRCILHIAGRAVVSPSESKEDSSENETFYGLECPLEVRSRVFGYFVSALHDRMATFNVHHVRYLDRGLRQFVTSIFADLDKLDMDCKQTVNEWLEHIQIVQAVFVMFPDLVPLSLLRHLISMSTKCRERISELTTALTEDVEGDGDGDEQKSGNSSKVEIDKSAIIGELRFLYECLRPIHGISLNLTNGYKTPSFRNGRRETLDNIPVDDEVQDGGDMEYENGPTFCPDPHRDSYPSSSSWGKQRELLVGTLFELFLYINESFEWYLQQMERQNESHEEDGDDDHNEDVIMDTTFTEDLYLWFSSVLTVISHSLIGMNSEGKEDYFFELDWSSLIFTSNFVMDHIMHRRTDFTLCLHSSLSEFYQFLLCAAKPNGPNNLESVRSGDTDISILNIVDSEYRYNMTALWHGMAVLRQIALRSTDLSGRQNLKTKRNRSFIFESLELLTEILGNETWRNVLSSEALASPLHKLGVEELEVEQLVFMSSAGSTSGIMAKTLSEQQNVFEKGTFFNITPRYETHAILDELYFSIHDLLNHPVVSSGSSLSSKLFMSPLNQPLSSIVQSWHHPLFDALNSSHHQIVAAAFRILTISTRFHVLQNLNIFTSKRDDNDLSSSPRRSPKGPMSLSSLRVQSTSMPDINEEMEVEQKGAVENNDDANDANTPSLELLDLAIGSDVDDDDFDEFSNSDAVSVISAASCAASVSFSQSQRYSMRKRNKNRSISKTDRSKFERVHATINQIIPVIYLLPQTTRDFVPRHEVRRWLLSWFLLLILAEEVPLEFRQTLVRCMKHDDKSRSPLGSHAIALRELLEHLYVAPSLTLSMADFVKKHEAVTAQQQRLGMAPKLAAMFQFDFDLEDFRSNLPVDHPTVSGNTGNLMPRCKWLQQATGTVLNKKVFFSGLAVRIYSKMLQCLPGSCRYWATSSIRDRVTRSIVSTLSSEHFSPLILKGLLDQKRQTRALSALRAANSLSKEAAMRLPEDVGLKIKCLRQTREIEIVYHHDEVRIEMTASFPVDYPLKTVTFEWREGCGLPPKKMRKWQMLMRGMVNNQNATVVEAVSLLAVNIWNHYEGMDECPICYSVVHPTKKTLPKVRCGTCKGKFHRYCIYKWTKTSQKSTCPLCRSLI